MTRNRRHVRKGKKMMKKLFAFAVALLALTTVAMAQTDLGTITLINGDVDGDNAITTADLSVVLANMGQTTTTGDLDGNGTVASADVNIVLKNLDLLGDL